MDAGSAKPGGISRLLLEWLRRQLRRPGAKHGPQQLRQVGCLGERLFEALQPRVEPCLDAGQQTAIGIS